MTVRAILAASVAVVVGSATVQAAQVAALTGDNGIVIVDTNAKKVMKSWTIQGIVGKVVGIDVRPADGMLYALAADGGVYTVDISTGKATMKSKLDTMLSAGVAGTVDFNPVADRLRVIGSDGMNLRANVDDGKVTTDGALKFADNDMHKGEKPNVVAGAYTNSVKGAKETALFDIDGVIGGLLKQAPPNDGVLNAVGKLGVKVDIAAFDIWSDGAKNEAWLMTAEGLHAVDLATGKTSKVLVQGAKGKVSAADLSPDGKWLAANVETAAGESNAALVELASGKMRWLKPDPWEQAAVRFSPDGQDVLVRSNVDGRDVVYLAAIAGGEAREVPLPPGLSSDWFGLLPAFTPDGARLVFPHESGSEPLEYWVQDLKSGPGRPITRLSSLETKTLPRTRIVHYPSADGTIISAVLWIPNGVARNGHARGVVYPHGGPTGQTRDGFDRTPLALADRGFFVIAPNPRGSTGYGRAFMEANKRDLGGGDLEDEVAAAKFLTDTGYVDAHRIGITGGSYGGYMTLMAIGKTPEVWSAAVDEYGIVNWVSMYAHGSPQLRLYQAALIGTPERDKDVYTKTSPLTYLGNAKAPLLVLQGDTDIRVPREESEQIVAFLKAHGRTVEGHYYAEEGHGFMKRENQIDAMQRTIAWFERYLGGL